MVESCIAVIPARGGSVGIKHKNLQLIGGHSLIGRAILTAHAAASIGSVLVSTDCKDIAKEAERYKGRVIPRPDELADHVIMPDASVAHALRSYRDSVGHLPEFCCFMQCTSPFTLADEIDEAVRTIQQSNADSVFAASMGKAFLWRGSENGTHVGINHDHRVRVGRQFMKEKQYQEIGAFYVFRSQGFLENKHRFFGTVKPTLISDMTAIDIDTPFDLELARMMHQVSVKG